jgi:hypothetical protein
LHRADAACRRRDVPKMINALRFVGGCAARDCAAQDGAEEAQQKPVLALVTADRMGDVFMYPWRGATEEGCGGVTCAGSWQQAEFLAGHLSTVTAMVRAALLKRLVIELQWVSIPLACTDEL